MKEGKLYTYLGRGSSGMKARAGAELHFIECANSPSRHGVHVRRSIASDPSSRLSSGYYFAAAPEPDARKWQWQSMESAPDPGENIVYTDSSGCLRGNPLVATHWMELPPSPVLPVLPEPFWINGTRRANVDAEGNVNVGCETFSYQRIIELAELAKKTREENA